MCWKIWKPQLKTKLKTSSQSTIRSSSTTKSWCFLILFPLFPHKIFPNYIPSTSLYDFKNSLGPPYPSISLPFSPRNAATPSVLRPARRAPPDPLGSAAPGGGPACASPGGRSGDRRSPRARCLWKREATRLRNAAAIETMEIERVHILHLPIYLSISLSNLI